jgi:nucleoside-diphosphate-sugar epimerase
MNRFLVTGGDGFIGKRLLSLMNSKKFKVKLIARKSKLNYETYICNLGADNIPLDALNSVDTVIHMAGLAHETKYNVNSYRLYYETNVTATIDLANAAEMKGVKNFIFVSSTKAGGNPANGNCANENDFSEPEGSYGKSKFQAELKLLEISKNSKMNISIIRPALVYGPEMKGNLKLMLNGIKKGFFPPLPETGNKKSLIHVDDLVRAILFLAESNGINGEIFIATDGEKYSSRDIYNNMRFVLEKKIVRWSVPKFLFDAFALISPSIRYKLDKLLDDQCYSSEKLNSLGFVAYKKLKDMNETSF